MENVNELESKELGFKAVITYDDLFYDENEMVEINMMIASVMEAWHRRRLETFTNPKLYGFKLH